MGHLPTWSGGGGGGSPIWLCVCVGGGGVDSHHLITSQGASLAGGERIQLPIWPGQVNSNWPGVGCFNSS